MESSFEKELDTISAKIHERANPSKLSGSEAKVLSDFSTRFDELNTEVIAPIVETVNLKIGPSYNLEVINSPEEVSDIRKSVQIILTKEGKNFNILGEQYLLIEGYPKSGNVRIATSGSTENGETRPVSKVDPSIIQSELLQMIKKSIGV